MTFYILDMINCVWQAQSNNFKTTAYNPLVIYPKQQIQY